MKERETGMVSYTIPLTQNAWTLVTRQCPNRKGLSFQPSANQIAIAFGQNAPATLPTMINERPFTDNVINDTFAPAMVKEAIWAFTLAASVTMFVTEELYHDI